MSLKCRQFLNNEEHGGSAFIMWDIREDDNYPQVTLGDCNRQITLEFALDQEKDYWNTLEKIDSLYEMIKDFRREVKKLARKKAKIKGW